MKAFGERLRELRTEKGISALSLGKEVGVSDASIIDWENNKHEVKAEIVVRFAKYFGVTTDYLLGLEN